MSREANRLPAGLMIQGVVARTPEFTKELQLDFDTYNVTHGLQLGVGPRYGFATIPGMADNETISGTRYPGLRASEGSPAQGFSSRLKVLAVLPISLGTNTTPSSKINTYLWIVTRSGETIDFMISSTTSDITAQIYDGLTVQSTTSSLISSPINFFSELIPCQGGSRTNTLAQTLAYTSGKYYASTAIVSVTGADVPLTWYFGEAKSTGDSTHAPDIALQRVTNLKDPDGNTNTINCGVPSFFNLQNYALRERPFNVYTTLDEGEANTQYVLTVNPTSSIFVKDVQAANSTVLNIDGITATALVAGTPASTKAALVEDQQGTQNTSYKAALVASGKPFAAVFQDSYATPTYPIKTQWVDLTTSSYAPLSINTIGMTATRYSEEGVVKQTCFQRFPLFVRGTALDPNGQTALVTIGASNTGVLRANKVYELTYSLFNKRLNTESNVGTPVKFQVGSATDFTSLNLYNSAGSPSVGNTNPYSLWQKAAGNGDTAVVPFIFNDYAVTSGSATIYTGTENFLNFTQYRFYYREEGTFEWLPALFIDAAKYWFYNGTKITVCTGAISALPGGQPGAFNDYSTLPQDSYNCVLNYKDRAWWFSEKAINFSLRNNVFAYPGRNSINAQSGSFRGGIVHNYPGQAEQSSRLVIFGSDTTYVARFTGLPQQTQVQVSASTSATFDVDGSDLVIDPWTSVTAFSYRSAVVADGILYWWGPQGVYRDDGVNTPTKISGDDLEPNIFTVYDPNRIDEIHAFYDEQTKDITWFYVPRAAGGYATHTITYNTSTKKWLRSKYVGKIDWVSNLNVQTDIGTAGKRGIAAVRDTPNTTVQRAYFYDLNNRAGDMRPTTDFVVKQISTPATGQRRLTLAAGYDATNFATIATGDLISFNQVTRYANITGSDMIAEVIATNTGSGTIDIQLPDGGSLSGAVTLNYSDGFFPIWHKAAAGAGLNGITWQIKTGYWMPEGPAAYYLWLFWYGLHKVNLWASDTPQTYSLAYRTPTSLDFQTDTITLVDNSDGNFQLYHPLTIGNDNMEGQAIKFKLSGIHIGNEWTLQYVDSYARNYSDGDPLLRFEG